MVLFLSFYLLSFIFVMSVDDLFLVWLGLEINMLSFILIMYSRKSMMVSESCMKYFFIQSLGSVLLISAFYLNEVNYLYSGSLILSYKMGAGPFFYWFPMVCKGISWGSCLMLMSFQKIIPLVLMTFLMSWILWVIVLVSLIVGVMGSFNQINLKELMAYSSIHHMGWMVLSMILEETMWMYYLFMYFFMIWPLIVYLLKMNIENMMDLMKVKFKLMFILVMMSVGGMPPFLGFFLKWVSFYYIMEMNFFFIMFMIVMSVYMMYVYMRFIYKMMMGLNSELSWVIKSNLVKWSLSGEVFVFLGLWIGMMIGVMMVV